MNLKSQVLLLLFCPFLSVAQMEKQFYFPSKKLDPINVPHKEFNFFIESDTLNTILILPKKKKIKSTIVYFHGSGGNNSRYVKYVLPLANAGYQVLMIDLRGYGKSTGQLTHSNAITDAHYIFEKIQQLKEFKKSKFVVYGASMGSQVATRFTELHQDKIEGLILDGCISSFTEIAADKSPEVQRPTIRNFLKFPYSALSSVKNIKIPLLMIHSEQDSEVPFSHAQAVFKAANDPKKLWVYSGKHLEAPLVDESEFLKQINSFILNK